MLSDTMRETCVVTQATKADGEPWQSSSPQACQPPEPKVGLHEQCCSVHVTAVLCSFPDTMVLQEGESWTGPVNITGP